MLLLLPPVLLLLPLAEDVLLLLPDEAPADAEQAADWGRVT